MPYRIAQSFQGKVFLARIYEKSRALCRFSRAITCSLPLVMEREPTTLVRSDSPEPHKTPRNIRGPFHAESKFTMTARTWDPRRCVHKSRQPILRLYRL